MNLIAIIVLYEPNFTILRKLLDRLITQVNSIVIVDNASIAELTLFTSTFENKRIHYVKLAENFGIGYAQNIGIEWANNHGATHVLLMDQDSIPSPNMVQGLYNAFINASNELDKKPIGAIGPSYIDQRSGQISFFVTERLGLPHRKKSLADTTEIIDACFLIASGTLIPTNVISSVGGMRSNYFIDHVDTEWSFRVRANGFRLIGVPNAYMHHTLGDEIRKIWFFGKRQISYHSPLRDYYMFRNTILMLRDTNISLAWQFYFIWRLLQFASYFLLFSNERYQRLLCMSRGIWDGVRGIRGKLNLAEYICSPLPETSIDPI